METGEEKLIERKSQPVTESEGKSDSSNISPKKTVQLGVVSSQEGGRVSSGNSSKKSRWDQAPELEEADQPTTLEETQDNQDFPNVKILIQKFEETSSSSSETLKPTDDQKPTRVKLIRTNFMSSNKEKPSVAVGKEYTQFVSSKSDDKPDEKEPNQETGSKNESSDSSEVKPMSSSKALQIISSYYDSPTDESSQEAETLPPLKPTTLHIQKENSKLSEVSEVVDELVSASAKEEEMVLQDVLDKNVSRSTDKLILPNSEDKGTRNKFLEEKQDIGPTSTAENPDSLKDNMKPSSSLEIDELLKERIEEEQSNNATLKELASTDQSTDNNKEIIEEEILQQTELKSLQTSEKVEKTKSREVVYTHPLHVKETHTSEEEPIDRTVESSCIGDKPVDDWVVITENDLVGYPDTDINVEKNLPPAELVDYSEPNTSGYLKKPGSAEMESAYEGDRNKVSSKKAIEKEPVKDELCTKKCMYINKHDLVNTNSSNIPMESSGVSLCSLQIDDFQEKSADTKVINKSCETSEEEKSHVDNKIELTSENPPSKNTERLESSTNVPLQDESQNSEQGKVQLYNDEIDATMEEIFLDVKSSKDSSDNKSVKGDVDLSNESLPEKNVANSNPSEESDKKESETSEEQKSSQGLIDILETTESDMSTKKENHPSTSSPGEEVTTTSDSCHNNLNEESLDQDKKNLKDSGEFNKSHMSESEDGMNVQLSTVADFCLDRSTRNDLDSIMPNREYKENGVSESNKTESEDRQTHQVSQDIENVEAEHFAEDTKFKSPLHDDSSNIRTNINSEKVPAKHEEDTTANVESATKENLLHEPAKVEVNESKYVNIESSVVATEESMLIKKQEGDEYCNPAADDEGQNSTETANISRNISNEDLTTELQKVKSNLEFVKRESFVNTDVRNEVEVGGSVILNQDKKEPFLDFPLTTTKLPISDGEGGNNQTRVEILESEEISNAPENCEQEKTCLKTLKVKELVQLVEAKNVQELINESKADVFDEEKSPLLEMQTDLKAGEISIEELVEESFMEESEDQGSDSRPLTTDAPKNAEPSPVDDAVETIEAIDSFLKESDAVPKDTPKSLKLPSEEILSYDHLGEVGEPEKESSESVHTKVNLDDDLKINNEVVLEDLSSLPDDVEKRNSGDEKSDKKEIIATSTLVSEVASKTSLKTKSEVHETIQSVKKIVADNVKEDLKVQSKDLDVIQAQSSNIEPSQSVEKEIIYDPPKTEHFLNKRTIAKTDIEVEAEKKSIKTKVFLDSSLDKMSVSVPIENNEEESPTETGLLRTQTKEVLKAIQITQRKDSSDKVSSQAKDVDQALTEKKSGVNIVADKVIKLDSTIYPTKSEPTKNMSSNEPKLGTETILKTPATVQLEPFGLSAESPQQTKPSGDIIISSSSQDSLKSDLSTKDTKSHDPTKHGIITAPVKESYFNYLSSTRTDQNVSTKENVSKNQESNKELISESINSKSTTANKPAGENEMSIDKPTMVGLKSIETGEFPTENKPIKETETITTGDKSEIKIEDSLASGVVSSSTHTHEQYKPDPETKPTQHILTGDCESNSEYKDLPTSSGHGSITNQQKPLEVISESEKELTTKESETSEIVQETTEPTAKTKSDPTDKETSKSTPGTKSKILIKRPIQVSKKNEPLQSAETKSDKLIAIEEYDSEPKAKSLLKNQIHPVPTSEAVKEESSTKRLQEPENQTTEIKPITEKSKTENKSDTKSRIIIKRPTQISSKSQATISSTEIKPAKAIATIENKSESKSKDEPKPKSEETATIEIQSSTENQTKLLVPTLETKPAKKQSNSKTDLGASPTVKSTSTIQGSEENVLEPTESKLVTEKSTNKNKPETKTKITIKCPLQTSSKNEPSETLAETKPVTTIATKEVESEIKSKNHSIREKNVTSQKISETPAISEETIPESEIVEDPLVKKLVSPESAVKTKPVKEIPPVAPVRVSARQKQRQAAALEKAQLEKSTPESVPKKGSVAEKAGEKRAKKSLSPMKEIHIKIPSGKPVETKQSPSLIITQKSPKTPVSSVVHGKLEPITLKLSKEENPVIVRSSSLSPKKVLSPQSPQTKTLGYTLKIGKDSTTIIPKDSSLSPKVRDSSPGSSGSKSDTFGKVEYLIKDTGLTITPVSSVESQEQKLNKITLKLSKAGGHPEIKQEKNESWKAIQKLGEVDITPVEGKSPLEISKRKDKADQPSSEKKLKLSYVTVEPSTSSGPSKLQGLLTQAPLNQTDISGSGNFTGIGQLSGKEQTAEPLYEIGLLKPEEAPVVRKRGRPRKISSPDEINSPITHSLTAKNILAASLQHQTLQQQLQIQQLQQQQAMTAMMQQQEEDDGPIPMFQCPLFDLSDPMDSFMEPHPTIFPDQVQPVQEPILRSARGRPIGRSRRSRGAGISRGVERGGPRGRPRGSRGIKRMLEEMESLSYPDMEQPITLDNIDAEIPRIMEPVMATETTIALLRKSIEIKKENKARKPDEPESLHSDLEAKVREMKEKIEAAYKAELKSPAKSSPEKEVKKKKTEEKTPEKIEVKKGPPELIPIQIKDDKSNFSPRKSLDSSRKSLESLGKSSDSPIKLGDSPRKSMDSPKKLSDSPRKSLDGEKQKRLSTDDKVSDTSNETVKLAPKRKLSQDGVSQEKAKRKSIEEKVESSNQEDEESQESKHNENQEDMEVEQGSSQDSTEAEEVKTEPDPPPKPVKPRPKSKAEMKRIKREKDRLRREAKKLAALEALKAPPPNPNEEDTRMSASDPNGDGLDGTKKSRGMEVGDPEGKEFTVQDIAEYQWPLQGGELYMIQEQISTYLGVKSFKRKYPDLRRRPVEMEERTYLCDSGLVAESMCDLGLTAVSSSEVLDVLFQDFPEKYEELRKVMREKAAQELINKQKEKKKFEQSLSKSDLKEHAIQSALNWNQSLNRSRTETRKCHLDLQTWTIQYPRSRGAKMTKPMPKLGNYPVAVIPGQYTDYYKRYTPQELRYWPVNTVLYGPLQPNERNSTVNGSEGSQSESEDSSSSDDSSDSSSDGEGTEEEKERGKGECRACAGRKDGKPCTQCNRIHNSCANLTPSRSPNFHKYQRQSPAQKTCQRCNSSENQARLIFCDMCERGFHSHCVGLRRVPYGSWKCQLCPA